jgi:hypothetical protein
LLTEATTLACVPEPFVDVFIGVPSKLIVVSSMTE